MPWRAQQMLHLLLRLLPKSSPHMVEPRSAVFSVPHRSHADLYSDLGRPRLSSQHPIPDSDNRERTAFPPQGSVRVATTETAETGAHHLWPPLEGLQRWCCPRRARSDVVAPPSQELCPDCGTVRAPRPRSLKCHVRLGWHSPPSAEWCLSRDKGREFAALCKVSLRCSCQKSTVEVEVPCYLLSARR